MANITQEQLDELIAKYGRLHQRLKQDAPKVPTNTVPVGEQVQRFLQSVNRMVANPPQPLGLMASATILKPVPVSGDAEPTPNPEQSGTPER